MEVGIGTEGYGPARNVIWTDAVCNSSIGIINFKKYYLNI